MYQLTFDQCCILYCFYIKIDKYKYICIFFYFLRLIWRKGQSLQLLAMESKEVTKKEGALEHHKVSVHHGTLLLVLHLVCIQPSHCKTTLKSGVYSAICGMKEVQTDQYPLKKGGGG